MVYVLDIDGKPLMPTERHRWVRKSLKEGKAIVVRRAPFTIQLTYDSGRNKNGITLGIKIGKSTVGLSATTFNKELFRGDGLIRDDIKSLMTDRRTRRRNRRSRSCRYRPIRNLNRKNRIKCQTVTNQSIVQSHIRMVRLILSILPITRITMCSYPFDLDRKIQYKLGKHDDDSLIKYTVNKLIEDNFGKHIDVVSTSTKQNISAYELTGNTTSRRVVDIHLCRFVRRHNRQLHKVRYSKGGKRKNNQAAKYVGGVRLFDVVKWNGHAYFVSRRETRTKIFSLRDANWRMVEKRVPLRKIKRLYFPGTILVERRTIKENT